MATDPEVRTTVVRDDDIVTLLQDQHRMIRALVAEVREASGPERAQAFEPLVRLLAVHETSEQEVVYPVLERDTDSYGDVVAARREEEDAAERALADLESMDKSTVAFLFAFSTLAEEIDEHARNEEQTVFPALAVLLDPHERERMARAITAAQLLAPSHPHRHAPEGAAANLVVGPFLAIVDRARDAIRDALR